MAIHFRDGNSMAGNLASSTISGLASGLDALIESKTKKLQQKHDYEKKLTGLQALNVPNAEQLAHLDDNTFQSIVKNKLEEPSREAYASSLQSLLGGGEVLPQQNQPQEIPAQEAAFSPESITPEQRQMLGEYLKSPLAQQSMKADDILKVKSFLQQQPKKTQVSTTAQQKQPIIKPGLNERQATELAKIGLQRQKEERQLGHKEKQLAQKETKAYYDQVLASDKAARESDDRLNKMEKLVKHGSLPVSALYSGLKSIEENITPTTGAAAGGIVGGLVGSALSGAATGGIGAPLGLSAGTAAGTAIGSGIGALINPLVSVLRGIQRKTSPDTEEFEKLSSQFISGAKAVFGSRITDADLRAYMAQIPTLANTDAGKLKIIEDMKIANKAERVRAKAMKEIIKEYGYRPEDLPLLVEERAGKELDKLSKEFLEV